MRGNPALYICPIVVSHHTPAKPEPWVALLVVVVGFTVVNCFRALLSTQQGGYCSLSSLSPFLLLPRPPSCHHNSDLLPLAGYGLRRSRRDGFNERLVVGRAAYDTFHSSCVECLHRGIWSERGLNPSPWLLLCNAPCGKH